MKEQGGLSYTILSAEDAYEIRWASATVGAEKLPLSKCAKCAKAAKVSLCHDSCFPGLPPRLNVHVFLTVF